MEKHFLGDEDLLVGTVQGPCRWVAKSCPCVSTSASWWGHRGTLVKVVLPLCTHWRNLSGFCCPGLSLTAMESPLTRKLDSQYTSCLRGPTARDTVKEAPVGECWIRVRWKSNTTGWVLGAFPILAMTIKTETVRDTQSLSERHAYLSTRQEDMGQSGPGRS